MPAPISSVSTAGWGSAPQNPGTDLWEVISTLPPFISPLIYKILHASPKQPSPPPKDPISGGSPCPLPYLLCFTVEPSPESHTPTSACTGGTGGPQWGTQGVLGEPGRVGAALPQGLSPPAPRGQGEGTGWAQPHSTRGGEVVAAVWLSPLQQEFGGAWGAGGACVNGNGTAPGRRVPPCPLPCE